MPKGPKIIQISGIKGLIITMFVITCLIAGFVVFPAKVAESLWNYVAINYISMPQINLIQGILLWAMTALSLYLLNNKKFAISFQQSMELSDDEMKMLMNRIKMQKQAQKLNAMILKSDEIKKLKDIDGIQIIKDNSEQDNTTGQEESIDNIDNKKI